MEEKILKQMIAVVDATVEYNKTDFYKYDLHSLMAMYETPEFFWSVSKYGTWLMIIDSEKLLNKLRKKEEARFSFMRNPTQEPDSFLFYSSERTFHYKNEKLREVEDIEPEVWETWRPIQAKLVAKINEEFGEKESRHWESKINVHFGSTNTAKMIYKASHENGAESLLNILDGFHHQKRFAIDEAVVITRDIDGKNFFFSHMRNGDPVMCGGILFYNGKWHKHT